MKKNIYIILGDFRERDNNQNIFYIGFSYEKAIDTWLKYLKDNNTRGEYDYFPTKKGFEKELKELGKRKMFHKYYNWGMHSCATLITKRIGV